MTTAQLTVLHSLAWWRWHVCLSNPESYATKIIGFHQEQPSWTDKWVERLDWYGLKVRYWAHSDRPQYHTSTSMSKWKEKCEEIKKTQSSFSCIYSHILLNTIKFMVLANHWVNIPIKNNLVHLFLQMYNVHLNLQRQTIWLLALVI